MELSDKLWNIVDEQTKMKDEAILQRIHKHKDVIKAKQLLKLIKISKRKLLHIIIQARSWSRSFLNQQLIS